MGGLKFCMVFFHKIKDTFLFSPITLFNWIFEYVCYVPHGIMLIILNLCLDLMAINFNWSAQPWSIIQREISSMKLCKPLLTHSISHSTFSIYCTKLCLHFSCIVTFLEIIKHNMPKTLHMFLHLQC